MWPRKGEGRGGSFRPYISSWGEKAEGERECGRQESVGGGKRGKGALRLREEGREVSAAFFSGKGHRRRLPLLLHIASE